MTKWRKLAGRHAWHRGFLLCALFLILIAVPLKADVEDSTIATVSITGVLPVPISIDDVTVPEGDPAVFEISVEEPTGKPITISYETAEDTGGANPAIAEEDYSPTSGSVTIPAGEDSVTVTVPTVDDDIEEPDETFLVNLTDVTGPGYIEDGTGVGTILDTEGVPSIIVNDVTVFEGSPAIFTVSLSHPPSSLVELDYSTEDDTALVEEDYIAKSGTLEFAPGETTKTVTVYTVEDLVAEPVEDFFLNLDDVNDAAYIADPRGIGTIIDDDEGEEAGEAAGGAGEAESCVSVCPPPIPVVQGTKTDEITVDRNGDGDLDKGDRIKYQIHIDRYEGKEGVSGSELIPINGLSYLDPIDDRLKLVEGSLTASFGQIEVETIDGTQVIVVNAEEIDGDGWPLEVEFETELTENLSGDAGPVSGQGLIYTDNAPTTVTDDPKTDLISDQTLTNFNYNRGINVDELGSYLEVDKRVDFVKEETGSASPDYPNDHDRVASANSLLEYEITVENVSEETLNDLRLLEPVDFHFDFVADSAKIDGDPATDSLVKVSGSDFISLKLSGLKPGQETTVTYRVKVASPISQNLGYAGTKSIVVSGDKKMIFSDDPETKAFGDQTVVLFPSNCQYGSVSEIWSYWQSFIQHAPPGLLPVTVTVTPDSGEVTGRVAGEAGEKGSEETKAERQHPLRWVLYGKDRTIRNAGGAGSLVEKISGEKGEGDNFPKASDLRKYMPELAFYGAGLFSLGGEELTDNVQIRVGDTDSLLDSPGSRSVGHLYGQRVPNLPVYDRFTLDKIAAEQFLWMGRTSRDMYCLDKAYLPLLVDLGSVSREDLDKLPDSIMELMIIKENSTD